MGVATASFTLAAILQKGTAIPGSTIMALLRTTDPMRPDSPHG